MFPNPDFLWLLIVAGCGTVIAYLVRFRIENETAALSAPISAIVTTVIFLTGVGLVGLVSSVSYHLRHDEQESDRKVQRQEIDKQEEQRVLADRCFALAKQHQHDDQTGNSGCRPDVKGHCSEDSRIAPNRDDERGKNDGSCTEQIADPRRHDVPSSNSPAKSSAGGVL